MTTERTAKEKIKYCYISWYFQGRRNSLVSLKWGMACFDSSFSMQGMCVLPLIVHLHFCLESLITHKGPSLNVCFSVSCYFDSFPSFVIYILQSHDMHDKATYVNNVWYMRVHTVQRVLCLCTECKKHQQLSIYYLPGSVLGVFHGRSITLE